MAWRIEFDHGARAELRKLDRSVQIRIAKYLRERIATAANPRSLGAPLHGEFESFWRYRVGDYRIICDIRDQILTVLVVKVGHRRDVYDN